MVLSASSVLPLRNYGNSFAIVERQLIFAVLGVAGGIIAAAHPAQAAAQADPAVPRSSRSRLILATSSPASASRCNGNRNWLPLFGGFQLQPSEFAKLALVLWIADLYARRQKHLSTPRYVLTPMVPIAGAVSLLVVGQHDLGTALVLFALIVGMLWVAGLPARQMAWHPRGPVRASRARRRDAPHRVARLLNFTRPGVRLPTARASRRSTA